MAGLLETHRQKLIYQAALLGGACFLVSILLLVGNLGTHQAIADHGMNDKKVLLEQVLPKSLYDNAPLTEQHSIAAAYFNQPLTVYLARKNGIINGAVIQAVVQGWGGQIDFMFAVNGEGEITGARIISHKETPGLADKIEIDKHPWITSFNGKSLHNLSDKQWAVKKDGGDFDQFTGATITPRAVVNGIHQALTAYADWRTTQITQTPATTPSTEVAP